MKRFFFSVIFTFLIFSSVIFAQTSAQQKKLLQTLLDLPAPPPQNPQKIADKAQKMYPDDFYDPSNPPPDDAPIEDLLNYWEKQDDSYNEFRYNVKPSKETLKRIINTIEENPELLNKYLKILPTDPEVAEAVKRIYRDRIEKGENSAYQIQRWLKFNSDLFIDDLYKEAQNVRDENQYIRGDDEIIALAKVDWERARTIVARLESNPGNPASYALSKFILYHRAIREENTSDAESYRIELKKIVEDKKAYPGVRDLAMDALVLGGDFEGRDEWYMSLLSDETLLEMQNRNYTGLTTLPRHSPKSREKWIPLMTKLINEGTLAERSAAVRNMMLIIGEKNIEVVRLMLPLLADKNWIQESKDDERLELIKIIGQLDIPEAVPGLISIVMNEKDKIRAAAAQSLIRFKPPEAISALRFALEDEKTTQYRKSIVESLIAVGGLSVTEQMADLEIFAKFMSSEDGESKFRAQLYQYDYGDVEDEESDTEIQPIPINLFIGFIVSNQNPPDDALILRLIERLPNIQKTDPPTAKFLYDLMQNWDSRIVDLYRLKQLENGAADAEAVLLLLINRAELRTRVPSELSFIKGKNNLAGGITAVISENENEMAGVLNGANTETRISLLAAARLIRAKLPVQNVGMFLNSPDKLLALAAERYLESEDSATARSLILAKYTGETKLLGARTAFIPNDKNDFENFPLDELFNSVSGISFKQTDSEFLEENETKLREEIKKDPNLQAVFALIGNRVAGQIIIRVYNDKILFSNYEDEARYRERTLTGREYEMFYNFLLTKGIDGLAPTLENCPEMCDGGEFLMFGKNGGRRIFFNAHSSPETMEKSGFNDYEMPEPLEGLVKIFDKFAEGESQLKYRLAEEIPGLEVLLANKNLLAQTIWKKDGKLTLLIADQAKQAAITKEIMQAEKQERLANLSNTSSYRELRRQYIFQTFEKHLSWREFESGKLGDNAITQPADILFLKNRPTAEIDFFPINSSRYQRKKGNLEIGLSDGDIIKIDSSGKQTILREGSYANPLITNDGKWIVAGKHKNYLEPMQFVRINLQTRKEFPVKIPQADIIVPVSMVLSHNKILATRAKQEIGYRETENNQSPEIPEYYLVDAATGAAQLVKGEFAPLEQQTFRSLQPTGNPSEFWAAIPDAEKKTTTIGRYNDKTFTFRPELKIPQIVFDSMDMLVDEAAGKIYFVYEGHLLALPLQK